MKIHHEKEVNSHKKVKSSGTLTKVPAEASIEEDDPSYKSVMQKASFWKYIHFGFSFKTMKTCNKLASKGKSITDQHLPGLGYEDRAEILEEKFLASLENQQKADKTMSKRASLGLAILSAYKGFIGFVVFLQTFFIFQKVFSVWILKRLLDTLADRTATSADALQWAGILSGLLIISMYSEHHYFYLSTLAPTHIRAGLVSMIFNKVTRVSLYSLNQISLGKIVNIVANDVNVFERTGYYLTSIVTGLLALLSSGALLWIFFGPSCLMGIGCVILSFPLQQAIAKAAVKPRDQKNKITDERVKSTNEIIEGIRLLKMYTWELIFKDVMDELRRKEINELKKVLTYEGSSRGIAYSTQSFASFLIFLVYSLSGHDLEVSIVFPTLYLIGYIRVHAISSFASALLFLSEADLLFKRILDIMDIPEIASKSFDPPISTKNAAEFDSFRATWSNDIDLISPRTTRLTSTLGNERADLLAPNTARLTSPLGSERGEILKESSAGGNYTLSNINMEIKKGSLNALIGKVGCGKTSFLLSFTGELPQTLGVLRFTGKVAYVEQEPSIFAGTLRDNILFGRPYNPAFYHNVIRTCCLESDLKMFLTGDTTEVGEKGINLSGGQKARLALARAIYSDADIYLLDDPLSAVDAKVAKKLYREAICDMLKDKTVILATHQVHFVKGLKNIIVMDEGRVLGKGSYEELKMQGVAIDSFFSSYKKTISMVVSGGDTALSVPSADTHIHASKHSSYGTRIEIIEEEAEEEDEEDGEASPKRKPADDKGKLFSSEDKYSGKLDLKTYTDYMLNMGTKGVLFGAFFIFLGNELASIGFGRVLGLWADNTLDSGASMGIMATLTIGITAVYIIKNVMFNVMTLKASEKIHNRMSNKIVRAPAEFFDTNPVGRILNRFSNDMGVLDRAMSTFAIDVIEVAFTFTTNVITVAIITPPTLIPLFIATCGIIFILKFSYESIKQCRSYDLVSRSPMYSLFSSVLSGLIVIRSFDQENNFALRFRKMLNNNTKGNIAFRMCSRFFGFYVDYLYTLSAIASILIIAGLKNSNAGLSGLSLTYILGIAGNLQLGLRQGVQTNVLMASVARIQAYCDVASEGALALPGDDERRKDRWPSEGKIKFSNVSMRYRKNTDYVVRDLTFDAKPGEKIGCVGRTGAGKSSIIQTLFRMVEVEADNPASPEDKQINIDGVNTRNIGLHLLRKNISIIPQIPFIFAGTVRKNLDPLGLHTDDELWKVLEDVNLRGVIEKMEKRLESDMSNNSNIFSVGQKQLMCLARAILRKAKVLVLDEATANVDLQTDNFIQRKITEQFQDCTLFTIAHRLSTVAHYDKILVLDQGRKVEFDEPYRLLVKEIGDRTITNGDGHFASMVLNTGTRASRQILNIARDSFMRRHPYGV